MADKYFVTTSIPYVNGDPHLGHAMEFVIGDAIARYARLSGKKVMFSIGTDEHGGKILEKAKELGKDPKVFTDEMSQKFRDLAKSLNISNDRFIRTTDPAHEQRVQIAWSKLAGDIYKGKYEGWYCTGDEEFFTEETVKQNKGVCPDHNRPYEKLAEENYFFKLSKYAPQIKKAIEDGAFEVIPKTRRNEILSVIKSGLEDISISRPKAKIEWGVPVPNDETQVMYVWFEALLNYITVIGYPEHADFKTFWPADMQVIGKGILRFHAAVWPGMLLALGLPLPKKLYVHGYVTVDNKKMSKSLGNSIAPSEIINKHGADAFRYYFLRHIPSYNDGDFSWDKFNAAYNNELANELGNAVSRTSALIVKHQQGMIGEIPPPEHDQGPYHDLITRCRFDQAIEEVWDQVRGLNQYIDEEKPWEIAKAGDSVHLREVLAYQVGSLLGIAELLAPFLPETALKIKSIFGSGVIQAQQQTLFPKVEPPKPAVAAS